MRVFAIEVAVVLGLYATIKLTAFVTAGRRPAGRALAAYLSWPGVNPAPFTRAVAPGTQVSGFAARGALVMTGGLAGAAVLVVTAPHLGTAAVGWLGAAAILTTVHLGFADVLSGWFRRRYPVSRLFADPLASRSLREFWS